MELAFARKGGQERGGLVSLPEPREEDLQHRRLLIALARITGRGRSTRG